MSSFHPGDRFSPSSSSSEQDGGVRHPKNRQRDLRLHENLIPRNPCLQLITSHLFHRGFTTEFLSSLLTGLHKDESLTGVAPLQALLRPDKELLQVIFSSFSWGSDPLLHQQQAGSGRQGNKKQCAQSWCWSFAIDRCSCSGVAEWLFVREVNAWTRTIAFLPLMLQTSLPPRPFRSNRSFSISLFVMFTTMRWSWRSRRQRTHDWEIANYPPVHSFSGHSILTPSLPSLPACQWLSRSLCQNDVAAIIQKGKSCEWRIHRTICPNKISYWWRNIVRGNVRWPK